MIDDAIAYTPFIETDCRNYDGESMWEGWMKELPTSESTSLIKPRKNGKKKASQIT